MIKKPFSGFPAKAEVTPIPNLFFTEAMLQIKDIAELKIVLHIFWLFSRRRGYPRFVTYNELLSDPILSQAIEQENNPTEETLRNALHLAVQHGFILHLGLNKDKEHDEDIYFINTEAERNTIAKIQQGELTLPGLLPKKPGGTGTMLPLDIFSLYEQNIGMLTPIIAEELKEAERLYPADWIESAVKEAVSLNKRNWRYIARILERWSIEGKDDGKSGRDLKEKNDRDKYIRGKYGHMVQR